MVFFHKEITVSAEIKQNSDWLKPCCPNGHTHFSAFKRGCWGLWASGQFGFSWTLSVSDPALFCQQIKFCYSQPWRLLVTFWSLKSFGPTKKREVVYMTPSCAENVITLQPIKWQHIKNCCLAGNTEDCDERARRKNSSLHMLNTTCLILQICLWKILYSMHYVKSSHLLTSKHIPAHCCQTTKFCFSWTQTSLPEGFFFVHVIISKLQLSFKAGTHWPNRWTSEASPWNFWNPADSVCSDSTCEVWEGCLSHWILWMCVCVRSW